jgi:hypothetical protein
MTSSYPISQPNDFVNDTTQRMTRELMAEFHSSSTDESKYDTV